MLLRLNLIQIDEHEGVTNMKGLISSGLVLNFAHLEA